MAYMDLGGAGGAKQGAVGGENKTIEQTTRRVGAQTRWMELEAVWTAVTVTHLVYISKSRPLGVTRYYIAFTASLRCHILN
jgi:hypothetical protein